MKINELFSKDKTVFSCEIFPPKPNIPIETIYKTIEGLKEIAPDYISVTFGAGGYSLNQPTSEIAGIIQSKYEIPSMAHLTCINYTKEEVAEHLEKFEADGIKNILALRGDKNPDIKPKTDFKYASELVEFIKQHGDFSISAACYPEGHVESNDFIDDTTNLRKKVDAGVDVLVSQLFFDNDDFYRFIERARCAGIEVPIQAGIMPILNKKQIERIVSMCGASIPQKLTKILSKYGDYPDALHDAGIAYSIDQITDLLASDVDGIHLYTMNNPQVAKRIYNSVSNMLKM